MEQTNKFFGSMVSDPQGILQKLKAIKLLSWTVLVTDLLLFWLPFHFSCCHLKPFDFLSTL